MPLLRVHGVSVSADGFSAGPRQSLTDPMGVGGMALHQWLFQTRTFQQMHRQSEASGSEVSGSEVHGREGDGLNAVDDDFAARGFDGIGAWIIGRNMFGPTRGPWSESSWKGWWGDTPPFHAPVFVLTNHPRDPLDMEGGTTFHFVTGGVVEAYERATNAASGQDVRLGGGANTIRQYLAARLVDLMHVAASPVLLGSGEHLFLGLDLPALGYTVTEHVSSRAATHIVIRRTG
jgi:dihydrofolate reductase